MAMTKPDCKTVWKEYDADLSYKAGLNLFETVKTNENMFVGGIAFTVRVTRLAAGGSVTVQPSHYTSTTSRVVMVLTYDSEV